MNTLQITASAVAYLGIGFIIATLSALRYEFLPSVSGPSTPRQLAGLSVATTLLWPVAVVTSVLGVTYGLITGKLPR
jgi:hypothetical protein